MDNYPEPCMCGATDCRICGPLQGYRVKTKAPLASNSISGLFKTKLTFIFIF